MCWFCTPEKIHLKAQSIEHFYPNDVLELRKKEVFVDPMYHLIGFVIKQDVVSFMIIYVYLIQVFARMKNKLDTKSHRNSLIITLLLAANKAKDK